MQYAILSCDNGNPRKNYDKIPIGGLFWVVDELEETASLYRKNSDSITEINSGSSTLYELDAELIVTEKYEKLQANILDTFVVFPDDLDKIGSKPE